jgi:hypothetical protein
MELQHELSHFHGFFNVDFSMWIFQCGIINMESSTWNFQTGIATIAMSNVDFSMWKFQCRVFNMGFQLGFLKLEF